MKIGMTIPDKDDFVIVYVKSVDHAGPGFILCTVSVMHIKYTTDKTLSALPGAFHKDFAKVSVETYNDQCYRINLAEEMKFLSEPEVERYIQQARVDLSNNCTWFLEQKFDQADKKGDKK